jgi:hypothetical protein
MSLRKFSAALVLFIASVAAFAVTASAGTRGLVLDTPSSVSVNKTMCADGYGNPLPCLAVVGYVINNDGGNFNCQVYSADAGFNVFDGILAPGARKQWNITIGYVGQSYLMFTLYCNGTPVPGQSKRVKVTG